ncbi:MAG: 16S rRNA (uracil(1498)-N(3))-methyltransferase [Deltaproteobacteria bacterium]|nr:16S rRNA (uracil(1498)-N(3))-methyltransferase [Deltaproteobacteria bacterium]
MNLLLLEPSEGQAERFVVHGRRARHVREVLRKGPGDRIRVGLLEGPIGEAEIAALGADRLELICHFTGEAPPRPKLDLILAVPRPKSLAKLLPEIATLGVDRLILLRTWRVEKPYLSVDLLRPERYRPLLHEGMMQGRTTREPTLTVEPLFKPFIEDRAPALAGEASVRVLAHPSAGRSLAALRAPPDARVALVIGPEGGLIPYEVHAFEALGFIAIELGPRPLRVETACVAARSQIELLRSVG